MERLSGLRHTKGQRTPEIVALEVHAAEHLDLVPVERACRSPRDPPYRRLGNLTEMARTGRPETGGTRERIPGLKNHGSRQR